MAGAHGSRFVLTSDINRETVLKNMWGDLMSKRRLFCGDNMAEDLIMAEDVLNLTLYRYEKEHKAVPTPSQRKETDTENESFVNFVSCGTLEYQKKFRSKAVKKTLTIPAWLNEMAAENNANFSAVLQEALKKYLGL